MLIPFIKRLQNQEQLDEHAARELMTILLQEVDKEREERNPEQMAACLALLTLQEDNVAFFKGVISVLRQHMRSFDLPFRTLDIVGTGGDGANTVNLSTGSALLLASLGVKVAKHGNRASSSACGSADVLEALGLPIEQSPTELIENLTRYHFGFCFAPLYHHAFAHLRAVRQALGIPTFFNWVGPLLNPAHPPYLMVGVKSVKLLPIFGELLQCLPIQRALVFHSAGLDELSCIAPAQAYWITPDHMTPVILDATEYGLARCSLTELQGGNPLTNARLLIEAFSHQRPAIANTLCFNAGVGLYLYGMTKHIADGVKIAQEALRQGEPLRLIQNLRRENSNHAGETYA